jgi:putative glycosyltransferase
LDLEITVVTTLYRSAPYIDIFYKRIVAELGKLNATYEIIFVNDGSPDESLDIALSIQKLDSCVVVIDLSRNFGHHKAIMQGLANAKARKVFLIDCDLEEPPETLSAFHDRFNVGDCDVVYGTVVSRKGKWFERVSGAIFYNLFNYLSDTALPNDLTIARMMSRRYVASLLKFNEDALFLGGVMVAAGYHQVPLRINKIHKGSTTYTFKRKIASAVSAITSFSEKPLLLVFYSGLLISTISLAFVIWLIFQKFYLGVPVDGWTSLAVSIWMIGGLLMLFLGIIGIYIAKIFIETKQRPNTIVRQIYSTQQD